MGSTSSSSEPRGDAGDQGEPERIRGVPASVWVIVLIVFVVGLVALFDLAR
jgi:hypothetical protein